MAGTKACQTCPAFIAEYGSTQNTDYNNYIFTTQPSTDGLTDEERKALKETLHKHRGALERLADPWKHRSQGMKCATCMWYVKKTAEGVNKEVGRCRRHSPSMNGYPVVYADDWCGDHKVDETKV